METSDFGNQIIGRVSIEEPSPPLLRAGMQQIHLDEIQLHQKKKKNYLIVPHSPERRHRHFLQLALKSTDVRRLTAELQPISPGIHKSLFSQSETIHVYCVETSPARVFVGGFSLPPTVPTDKLQRATLKEDSGKKKKKLTNKNHIRHRSGPVPPWRRPIKEETSSCSWGSSRCRQWRHMWADGSDRLAFSSGAGPDILD